MAPRRAAKKLDLEEADGIDGAPVSRDGNQFDLVEDTAFWKALVTQLCGGKKATAGVTLRKWRLLGKLLYVASDCQQGAFASHHLRRAFVDSSTFPLDRIRALSTNDSFCNDLTKEQRRYLLSDEFHELAKLEFMKNSKLQFRIFRR